MRKSFAPVVLGLIVIASLAALWVIPSYAQMPGTLAQPAMSPARVWINNRTRDEAIPVNVVSGDPKEPLPVVVKGAVSVTGQVGVARQAWEYRSVEVSDQDPTRALNVYGNDGWEAVGATSQQGAKAIVLLKRPK